MNSSADIAKVLLETSGSSTAYSIGQPFHVATDKTLSPRAGQHATYSIREYIHSAHPKIPYAYVGHIASYQNHIPHAVKVKGQGRELFHTIGEHLRNTYPHIRAITACVTNPIALGLIDEIWGQGLGMEPYVLDGSTGIIERLDFVRGGLNSAGYKTFEMISKYTNPTDYPHIERFPGIGYVNVVTLLK